MSSIPDSKQALLHAIEGSVKKLIKDYREIPVCMSKVNAIEGNIKGTKISVCDTVSYLIGWGNLVLKWCDRDKQGLNIDFPETGYKWNELGNLAQHFHQQHQSKSYQTLLNMLENTTSQILTLIESLPEDKLYGENWYKSYTLGRMIQLNTSSPMKNIRTKIRKFKRQYNQADAHSSCGRD
ncbi:hypothetical protein CS022_17840 [Veronia nyctiphanis]|uniref:ClbS/DfsB family four-helix bundle protein n=1 Tax=Veronia nyctiphanis TaxID=1278244 RepID=A0A4Q0YSP6_9GAMM|nr:ClbS/DfsB family four-helix bundle protein [Veronia nyctiphanis]RXJ72129.1 hypothetical protein CS022_17840 [Veronia nyctiphanis]